jgi:uncharacterized protein (TIGR02246 family)
MNRTRPSTQALFHATPLLLAVAACAPAAAPPVAAAPAAPTPAPPSPAAGVSAQAGEQIVAGFVDAWNRRDMAAFGDLFVEDADFVNIFGTWSKGREEIRARHAKILAGAFRTSVISNAKVELRSLSPDSAVVRWVWQLDGLTAPDGTPAPRRTGLLLHVIIRTPAGFRIAAAQNTSIVPDPL